MLFYTNVQLVFRCLIIKWNCANLECKWNVHCLECEPKPIKGNGNAPVYISGPWIRAWTITWEAIYYQDFSLYTEKIVKNAACSVLSWLPDCVEGMLTSIAVLCLQPIVLSHMLGVKEYEKTLSILGEQTIVSVFKILSDRIRNLCLTIPYHTIKCLTIKVITNFWADSWLLKH